MRLKRKHKRDKVQIRYLERRLYKTERRIEKFNAEALMLRRTIKLMHQQTAKKKADRGEVVNKALYDIAIKSVPATKGGTENASNTRKRKKTT